MRVTDLTRNVTDLILVGLSITSTLRPGILVVSFDWLGLNETSSLNSTSSTQATSLLPCTGSDFQQIVWRKLTEEKNHCYHLTSWCCHTGVTQMLILSGRLHWWISLLIVPTVKYQGWNSKHICPITCTGNEQCSSMNFLSVCYFVIYF